jgi:tetratricopeptide (TPR) repeat protein
VAAGVVPAVVLAVLSACSSAPEKADASGAAGAGTSSTAAGAAGQAASSAGGAKAGTAGAAGANGGGAAGANGAPGAAGANGAAGGKPPAAPVALTARGKADFDRAVGFMRSGNSTEAELEFKQLALQFPQLATPYVNLGILYRKGGHLDQSEDALKTAVQRNDGNAVAWTELGATQRLRGEFPNAAASYEHAIAADPNFAPAYRNLGVVSDLYLGDPERALTAFERYKELSGEEKPVSGWIAELRQRTGKPPLKRPAPAAAPSDAPAGENPAAAAPSDAAPAAAAPPPPKAGG